MEGYSFVSEYVKDRRMSDTEELIVVLSHMSLLFYPATVGARYHVVVAMEVVGRRERRVGET